MANLHLTFLIVFTSLQQLMLLNVDVKSVPNVLSSLSHLTHFSCNQVLPDNFASNNFKHWTKIRILNVTDVSPKHLLSVQQLEQLSIDLRMRDVHKTVERFIAVLSSLTRLLHSLSCDIRTHFAQFLPATSWFQLLTSLRFDCCERSSYFYSSTFGHLVPLTSLRTLELGECHLRKTDNSTILRLFSNLNNAFIECSRYCHVGERRSDFFPLCHNVI